MSWFSEKKIEFDEKFKGISEIEPFVLIDGEKKDTVKILNNSREKLEEYYKWQFLYGLVYSGSYPKENIGTEIRFPKGNKNSAPLRVDSVVFDSSEWPQVYKRYWKEKKSEDLEWLNQHIVVVIEFKRGDKDINAVYSGQIKPALKEKDPTSSRVFGIYYDQERLFLFQRIEGLFLRYDAAKNQKGEDSGVSDLSLQVPDSYHLLPTYNELIDIHAVSRKKEIDNRDIEDLDRVVSIISNQIRDSLSVVLRSLDRQGLTNQRGYEIIIQAFAMKIFDEKKNDTNKSYKLNFYITDKEFGYDKISSTEAQSFIKRMKDLWDNASYEYVTILRATVIDWKNENHVRVISNIVKAFQDFSFVNSRKSDLYQLVFYNFASHFKRDESAQFLTPIPIIDFIVRLVNPRKTETVIDPCCGIGDFLSLSFVNSQESPNKWNYLDDANIFGVDVDENMIMLATLNMLLNGDGEAKLLQKPDKGSILYKVSANAPFNLVELDPKQHKGGNWFEWSDTTKLKKFDVVLTNPPFGEDRAYKIEKPFDREVIEMYETWDLSSKTSLDLGVVFLENTYRILKDEGRFGIVLSNSIASTDKWTDVRKWLMDRIRIVAIFDLPAGVFAETGNNTSVIIGYKPIDEELNRLNNEGYKVFAREIKNVGYEKRSSKRNSFFRPIYRFDEETFSVQIDSEGNPVLQEDFSEILNEFRNWALYQESTLKRLFVED